MFGNCKVCGKPAVTASQYCVVHWDEVWEQHHSEIEGRFFADPTRQEVRVTTPTEVEFDSCWLATDAGDNTPMLDGYVFLEERDNDWIWHKLERTNSAA